MNLLGIDYGGKRVGLATGTIGLSFASPLMVIENKGDDFVIEEIKKVINTERSDMIIIGIPYTLDSKESEQTRIVLSFIEKLEKEIQIPVHKEDERLTSRLAHSFEKQGADPKLHDALAAMNILQSYLDKNG